MVVLGGQRLNVVARRVDHCLCSEFRHGWSKSEGKHEQGTVNFVEWPWAFWARNLRGGSNQESTSVLDSVCLQVDQLNLIYTTVC